MIEINSINQQTISSIINIFLRFEKKSRKKSFRSSFQKVSMF